VLREGSDSSISLETPTRHLTLECSESNINELPAIAPTGEPRIVVPILPSLVRTYYSQPTETITDLDVIRRSSHPLIIIKYNGESNQSETIAGLLLTSRRSLPSSISNCGGP
jgi:hypothetical protein